ncbi:hypothetical protein H0H92_005671 [Tricholoma furcatifolium]|nr:hypothetical protein H0H92_005671 [Tricholoma furcatifolium]
MPTPSPLVIDNPIAASSSNYEEDIMNVIPVNVQAPRSLPDPLDIPSKSYLVVPEVSHGRMDIPGGRIAGNYRSSLRTQAQDVLRDGRLSANALPSSFSCSSFQSATSSRIDVEQQDTGSDATNRTTLACPVQYSDIMIARAPEPKLGHDYSKVFWNCIRNLYHILLFGVPNFYRYRVHQVFWEVSYVESEVMSELVTQLGKSQIELDRKLASMPQKPQHHSPSPQEYYSLPEIAKLVNLKTLWEGFIDKCIHEWKAANLIAILLLGVIVATLQLSGGLSDGIVRTFLFLSLSFAFMSVLYGCIFWVRFSTMHPVHKAFAWAKDSKNEGYHIIWNTWILLSMPMTWLSWSLIFYVAGIMSYIWRTPWVIPGPTMSSSFELISKLSPSLVLVLGILHFVVIARALHEYGSPMDKKWRATVQQAAEKQGINIQRSSQSMNRE